jgi:hypothetical protein
VRGVDRKAVDTTAIGGLIDTRSRNNPVVESRIVRWNRLVPQGYIDPTIPIGCEDWRELAKNITGIGLNLPYGSSFDRVGEKSAPGSGRAYAYAFPVAPKD